jgi:hypothetical protein
MKNVKRVKGPTPRPILYPTPPSALRLFRRKRPTMTQLSVTGVVLRTHRAPSSAATEKPTSASPTAAGTALRTSVTIDFANRWPESAGGALIHRTFPLPQDRLCPTGHASGAGNIDYFASVCWIHDIEDKYAGGCQAQHKSCLIGRTIE